MSVNITHIDITGITQPRTIMHMHDRIEAAIKISGEVCIEGHFIEDCSHGYRLVDGLDVTNDVIADNLMFILGCVSQRIFPVETIGILNNEMVEKMTKEIS